MAKRSILLRNFRHPPSLLIIKTKSLLRCLNKYPNPNLILHRLRWLAKTVISPKITINNTLQNTSPKAMKFQVIYFYCFKDVWNCWISFRL